MNKPNYHWVHINFGEQLYNITKDKVFREYADR